MKTNKILLMVSLLVFCIFLMTSCMSATAATTQGSANAQSTTMAGNSVSISNFAFVPATLTIKVGTTVVWTNNDSASHNIKAVDFNSSLLAKGQTYEFKFDKAGSYDYSCGVHPTMTGKIIVQ